MTTAEFICCKLLGCGEDFEQKAEKFSEMTGYEIEVIYE